MNFRLLPRLASIALVFAALGSPAAPVTFEVAGLHRFGMDASGRMVNPSPRAGFVVTSPELRMEGANFNAGKNRVNGNTGSFTGLFDVIYVGASGALNAGSLDSLHTPESLSFLKAQSGWQETAFGTWQASKFMEVEAANPDHVIRSGFFFRLSFDRYFTEAPCVTACSYSRLTQEFTLWDYWNFSQPHAFADSLSDFDPLNAESAMAMIHDLMAAQRFDSYFIEESSNVVNGVFNRETFSSLRGYLQPVASAVPEPSVLLLASGGLLGLALTRRRSAASRV